MVDIPTAYNQRQVLFFEKAMDESLSDGNILEELAKFLGDGMIEKMDDYLTDLVPDEEDLCDLRIIRGENLWKIN